MGLEIEYRKCENLWPWPDDSKEVKSAWLNSSPLNAYEPAVVMVCSEDNFAAACKNCPLKLYPIHGPRRTDHEIRQIRQTFKVLKPVRILSMDKDAGDNEYLRYLETNGEIRAGWVVDGEIELTLYPGGEVRRKIEILSEWDQIITDVYMRHL